jgi:hypothetical protein
MKLPYEWVEIHVIQGKAREEVADLVEFISDDLLERHGDQRQRRIIGTPTTLTIFGKIEDNKGKMSNNGFVPKYTHPFTLEEAMLLEINILVQGKLS